MRIDADACAYDADGRPGPQTTIGTDPHPSVSIRTPPHRFQQNHFCKLANLLKWFCEIDAEGCGSMRMGADQYQSSSADLAYHPHRMRTHPH